MSHSLKPADLIEIKASGGEYGPGQIAEIVGAIMDGGFADYQTAAWLMAWRLRGATRRETAALTQAMAHSGRCLGLAGTMDGPVVDKHSAGGVGDKLTLTVASMLAAAGCFLPKMSGRALGHTGGTIDKLEAIPGFNCDLSIDDMIAQTRRIGLAIVAQSSDLAPADGVLYALRDVTATVMSTSLISASIISKKLAIGADPIILDVKCGAGAFMRTLREANELASLMVAIGGEVGRRVRALVTAMDRPLGRMIGNALEVREAIATLKGEGPDDVRELSLALATIALVETGLATNAAEARIRLARLLDDGSALEKFRKLIEAQGGDPHVVDNPDLMGSCTTCDAGDSSHESGWIKGIDPMAIALAAKALGGGRQKKGDAIDPLVGIELLVQVGDRIEKGQPLVRIHARNSDAAIEAFKSITDAKAFHVSDTPVTPSPLVLASY